MFIVIRVRIVEFFYCGVIVLRLSIEVLSKLVRIVKVYLGEVYFVIRNFIIYYREDMFWVVFIVRGKYSCIFF